MGLKERFNLPFPGKKGDEPSSPQPQDPKKATQAGNVNASYQGPAKSDRVGFLFGKIFRKETPSTIDLGEGEIAQYEKEQQEIEKKLEHYRATRVGIGHLMRHPLRVITEKPLNILILSVPIALIFFVFGTAFMIRDYGLTVLFEATTVDDIAVLSILIVIVPLAVLDFREAKRIRHLEEALPNFFRDLAGMNDSGMTLPNAVHLVAQSEYSTLTPFIRRMDNEMSWNTTFIEAIQRFRARLGTPLSDRSIDLIAKASKAGGNISEVLRAAAKDTYEFIQLSTERRNNMLIYVVIVIISFLVFVFVIFILVTTFLTTMASVGNTASSGGGAASSFIGTVNLFLYTRLFAHAAIIQGLFSGIVAGQMGEGRAVAGLKYSAIMVIIAWVMFRFFV